MERTLPERKSHDARRRCEQVDEGGLYLTSEWRFKCAHGLFVGEDNDDDFL